MQKEQILEAMFGAESIASSYIVNEQAGTQSALCQATMKWAFRQVKLTKEDQAKVSVIIGALELAGVFNKSQLDQSLDKLGLIVRAKGSRGKGKAIDTTALTF